MRQKLQKLTRTIHNPLIRHIALTALLAGNLWAGPTTPHADEDVALRAVFQNPPAAASPGVWWRWISGCVSKEGITRDFSEMTSKGISSVDFFGEVLGGVPGNKLPMMGSPWRAFFRHALQEADRLGIEITFVPASGWGLGGSWIDAEYGAKRLEFAELQLQGPTPFDGALPQPVTRGEYYRDVAVLAFPVAATAPLRPSIRASSSLGGFCGELNYPAEDLLDGDPTTVWQSGRPRGRDAKPESIQWLEFVYPVPVRVTALQVACAADGGPYRCRLESAREGGRFESVKAFELEAGVQRRIELAAVTASTFRLVVETPEGQPVKLGECWLLREGDVAPTAPGIKWWAFKSANRSFWDWPKQGSQALEEEYAAPESADLRRGEAVDLSSRLTPEGRLTWNVPPGRWIIVRFGTTLLGQSARFSNSGGYEPDFFSPAAADRAFDSTIGKILAEEGPVARRVIRGILVDSWEVGASTAGLQPNWTPQLLAEFRARRGYDPLPYLPALTRRVVENRRTTDLFLRDWRWTIADLYTAFYARLADRARKEGLFLTAQCGYGTYPLQHIDGLAAFGRVDIPQGEFWASHTQSISMSHHYPAVDSIRTAASAAHIYGKRLVAAESLTGGRGRLAAPGDFKARVDEEFCKGLNSCRLHLWSHQSDVALRPGLETLDLINANMTWWPHADGFLRYLARTQHLLRQGHPVVDVAYYVGEGSSTFVPGREYMEPALPAGFEYDGLNTEALQSARVEDGRLVISDDARYRYLVLGPRHFRAMSPAALGRLRQLVEQGLTLVGRCPPFTPDLRDLPGSEARLRQDAAALWGDAPAGQGERHVGQGRVIWGRSLAELFAADGLQPDVVPTDAAAAQSLRWYHRRDGQRELYFLSNQAGENLRAEVAFRVSGKSPELLDPVTGQERPLPEWRQDQGRTFVPLSFAPAQSFFVVFHKPSGGGPEAGPGARRNFPALETAQSLAGPWEVQFDPHWFYPDNGSGGRVRFERLADWAGRPEAPIAYFSGMATYKLTFKACWAKTTPGVYLDLGTVRNTAHVRLNGRDLGSVWTAPWRVEVSGALHAGNNELEIEVANVWNNRLVGDSLLPPDQRRTSWVWVGNKNEPPANPGDNKRRLLAPSGLLGPVTIQRAEDAPR